MNGSLKLKTLGLAVGMLTRCIALLVGPTREVHVRARLMQLLEPVVEIETRWGAVKFLCVDPLLEYRARTLLEKEPETIAWIDGFAEGDVLWDIGANVGVYSLYAAVRGHEVLSFEPSPGNSYILSRNIELNGLDSRISAYCVAFSDVTELGTFQMSSTVLGGSLNSFGDAIDWQGKRFIPEFRQAAIGFAVDEFITQFSPRFPNHIKIDVDGIEKKIILGARKVLADKRLRSVLVELNTEWPDYDEIIAMFIHAGLLLERKLHAAMFDDTQMSSVFNHVFVRSHDVSAAT
jgi:FkbM family methyltransferase